MVSIWDKKTEKKYNDLQMCSPSSRSYLRQLMKKLRSSKNRIMVFLKTCYAIVVIKYHVAMRRFSINQLPRLWCLVQHMCLGSVSLRMQWRLPCCLRKPMANAIPKKIRSRAMALILTCSSKRSREGAAIMIRLLQASSTLKTIEWSPDLTPATS